MGLIGAKIIGFFILLVASLVMGLIPFKLTSCLQQNARRKDRALLLISCIQCFGGGILLATVFAHMLPEVREDMLNTPEGKRSDFPLAEVLVCCGMFTIYILEEMVELCLRRKDDAEYSQMDREEDVSPDRVIYDASQERTLLGDDERTYPPGGESPWTNHHHHSHPGTNTLRVFIVAIALALHSVFEGMAVGLESLETDAWLLIGAVAIHKSIIAFCLGEQLSTSSQSTRRALLVLAVFVVASPLGVVLGAVVKGTSDPADPAQGHVMLASVLQALAAGTILYVVVFEIIQGEREKPGGGVAKLCAVLFGFAFMLAITRVFKEPEGNDAAGHLSSEVANVQHKCINCDT